MPGQTSGGRAARRRTRRPRRAAPAGGRPGSSRRAGRSSSCGSSSMLVALRTRPTGVTRGSDAILKSGPLRRSLCTSQVGNTLVCITRHRPKLHELERSTVLADPALPVEHRAAIADENRDRGDGKERNADDEQQSADGDVEGALHALLPCGEIRRLDVDDRLVARARPDATDANRTVRDRSTSRRRLRSRRAYGRRSCVPARRARRW